MASQSNTAQRFYGDYSFNTGEVKRFSAVDYGIFAAVLAISAGIGAWFAWKDRRKKGIDEFLLAGRNMSPFPVALSLLASFMSAITLLGTPAEMYNFTTMYWWIGLGYFLVIAGASHIYIPVFYNLGVTSAYEYLERRFSRGVRTSASMTFVLQMILYMAIVLYAPSLALHSVTGFTLWGSVVSVGAVCTLYTAFGGMKAVLWTDSFQVIMMVISLLAILIQAAVVVGGWGYAWESADRTNRIWFTDFSVDPSVRHSVWSLTIGAYFTWVAIFGTNQAMVQRAVTCPTLKKAQIAMWLNFPGLCIILYLSCFIGMFMASFYEKCDPLTTKFVSNANEILPMFVMDILGHVVGLPGLFVAGLFSGALSTISSGLNSISACVLEDICRAYFKSYFRESRARLLSQLLALGFGIICLAMTYVASLLGNILQAALSLFGMIGGPLLGVFTLGMFFPWANKWGAYSGLFGSLILMFWIGVGAAIVQPPLEKAITSIEYCNFTTFNASLLVKPAASNVTVVRDAVYPLYTLSYMWYSATAVAACVVIGLIVSFITGATKPTELDARVICPIFDVLFPFLPESIRKPLRFGVVHEGKHDRRDSTLPEKTEKKNEDVTNGHVPSEKSIDSENEKLGKNLTNGHALSGENDEKKKNDQDVSSKVSAGGRTNGRDNYGYVNNALTLSNENIISTRV